MLCASFAFFHFFFLLFNSMDQNQLAPKVHKLWVTVSYQCSQELAFPETFDSTCKNTDYGINGCILMLGSFHYHLN